MSFIGLSCHDMVLNRIDLGFAEHSDEYCYIKVKAIFNTNFTCRLLTILPLIQLPPVAVELSRF